MSYEPVSRGTHDTCSPRPGGTEILLQFLGVLWLWPPTTQWAGQRAYGMAARTAELHSLSAAALGGPLTSGSCDLGFFRLPYSCSGVD
jgi:hypothetical protein